jgi:hypothetical protein
LPVELFPGCFVIVNGEEKGKMSLSHLIIKPEASTHIFNYQSNLFPGLGDVA